MAVGARLAARFGVGIAALAVSAFVFAAPASADSFTVKTLHFDVTIGPANDQHCDIVGDLYKPASASAQNPAPAVLTTNGFGGSKDDQADFAKQFAARGYVVLSYSGLGFGGSTCKINLDDPDYDGKAGSQLVTFLGGGNAATDGTKVDYVKLDSVAHDGKHHAFDPRVGMIGGSYGGEIQFSIAGIDPRVDTLVPEITWNDLSYSLAPNNTSFDHGVTYQIPGVEKFEWTSLFFGLGIADGIEGASADPSRNTGCPNFNDTACGSKLQMDAEGAPNDATLADSRHASVESYMQNIKIPTLLAQGQTDTLFLLNEAIATYRALKAQGVPVAMIWHSWGHSGGDAAGAGEQDFTKDPAKTYETRVIAQWFDHYLGGASYRPPLDVSYWRDWIHYTGDATPAYAHAPSYPFGGTTNLYLSGSDALASSPAGVSAGSSSFTTPSAGAPTSYTETSALDQSMPVTDAPGTFAEFTGQPLSSDLDVIGVPTATVSLSAPTFQAATPGGGAPAELVLFFKLYDIQPDGTVVLTHRLIAPVRVADFTHPVTVTLPGIVHRFPKGDRIALTIAASDAAYKGNNASGPVTVSTDPANPGVLTLPTVAPADQLPIAVTPLGSGPVTTAAQCVDRRKFAFRVHQPRHGRVVSATAFVNGKFAKQVRAHRVTRIALARLPKGVFKLKIVAITNRHSRTVSVRTYRGCTKSRPHTRVHRHRHRRH